MKALEKVTQALLAMQRYSWEQGVAAQACLESGQTELAILLAPSQSADWPLAPLRAGGTLDLRDVPGPEAHTHDGAFMTDLTGGWVAVTNPRLDLTFSLHWDPAVYKWLILWLPYGGCEALPLTGMYALGIEPWTARYNLEGALAEGSAITLAGGASFHTAFQARLARGTWTAA